ncbi:hypothetical protein SCLCIDRAFT_614063 [Scleroderma citrinum Foug A]|uniref:Uncharacterized protein n=1 Tax=Scleroderma citrinum Foug A TaxID=1036808 RepID=A0A0C3E9N5_9AGAM|nr:hypothetical protein SCLCIDRAFT_614063 [Scleroderma citrinum Foug A]
MNASVNIANINTQARTHPAPPNKATPSRTESGRLTYSTRPLTTANIIGSWATSVFFQFVLFVAVHKYRISLILSLTLCSPALACRSLMEPSGGWVNARDARSRCTGPRRREKSTLE